MCDRNIFYNGNNIVYINEPYNIEFVDFIKPGKGKPFVRVKIRNLINGKLVVKNFKSINNLKKANILSIEYIYIYNDNKFWYFINKYNFDQIFLDEILLNKNIKWLQKNNIYNILFWNNKPINIKIPNFIYVKVVDFIFNIKGNTIKNSNKKALLKNGNYIDVPLFVKKGDIIKVDTRKKKYISRK